MKHCYLFLVALLFVSTGGIQGGVLPVNVCIDNSNIDDDMKKFSQALSDLGELTGERMRTLSHILEEMEYY